MPRRPPPEEVSVDDLRSLTLIVATQRSGSTLLARDMESLGGLGHPREHFRGVKSGKRSAPTSQEDVLAGLREGVDKFVPGVTGLKMQVGQSEMLAEALVGRRPTTPEQAMSTVVSWAQERFERVNLVVLVRNAIDIAVSLVFANETGTYTSRNPRALQPGAPLPEIDDINERILEQFDKARRHLAALNTLADRHSDLALLLTYDDLTNQVEETTRRVLAHARTHGFEPRKETVTRVMEKVISAEESARVREAFLDYLRTETGVARTTAGYAGRGVPVDVPQ